MTNQVTLIGGPYDGLTIDDPGGMIFNMWDPTRDPTEAEIRYFIPNAEPEKAYYQAPPDQDEP